jgi:hypothetical protein
LPLPNRELGPSKKADRVKAQVMADAERARCEAQMNHEKPKVYISYGFSDLDIFTNVAYTWDLWVKFPFKVPKDKCGLFKEKVQKAFEEVFLS